MILSIFHTLFKGTLRLYIWPLLGLCAVFAVSLAIGAVLPHETKLYLLGIIGEKFDGILAGVETPLQLTGRIFRNNLFVAVIAYVLGFTVVLPLFIVISNGVIMGIFFSLLFRLDALSPGILHSSLISLVPHGIFELTAFFLAAVLSMVVPIKAIWHRHIEPHKPRLQFAYESLLRFCIVVIPCLVVAAFIEVYASNAIGSTVGDWLSSRSNTEQIVVPLNPTALAREECLLQAEPGLDSFSSSSISASLTTTASVLYDEAIYQQLRLRKHLPHWEEQYYCQNNTNVVVHTWPREQWDTQRAKELQYAIFSAAGYPVTISKDGSLMTVTIDAAEYYVGFFEQDAATVMLMWNVDGKDLASKLLL